MFMFSSGHDVYNEFKDYRIKLQQSLQKVRLLKYSIVSCFVMLRLDREDMDSVGNVFIL